ncbi:MAG: family 43 glycosylhydrolase [Candidatus Krumholzibacteriia bacterium]
MLRVLTLGPGTTAVAVALLLFLSAGCDDSPAVSNEGICCSPGAGPAFLASKVDDDDGDGNPRDENHPIIDDEDDDIADHAWFRDDRGTFHLFFQNEGFDGGSDIEHYVTTDLRNLQYVGLALRKNPGGWDADGVWAPHVIQLGNTYFMFYTGVAGTGPGAKQRTGVATSTDLTTWKRFPANNCPGTSGDGCIYECDESWTTWGDSPGSHNQQCRDPFVVRDRANHRWVLFATAKSVSGSGVVTVAYSTDLTNWTGAGYINATRRLAGGTGAQATGGQAENPHVTTHDGTNYLLFTDWQDPEDSFTVQDPRTITQYVTSPTLVADTLGSSNWTYRGSTPDPGVNAIEVQLIGGDTWVMSQSISNVNSGDHPEHRRELRLKCVLWGPNFEFETSNLTTPIGTTPHAKSPLAPQHRGPLDGD